MQTFPDWLKDERTKAGLSQEKLAQTVRELDENSAVYQARVTAWERGKELPTLRQLVLMAIALRMSGAALRIGRSLWEGAQLKGLPAIHELPESEVGFGEGSTLTASLP